MKNNFQKHKLFLTHRLVFKQANPENLDEGYTAFIDKVQDLANNQAQQGKFESFTAATQQVVSDMPQTERDVLVDDIDAEIAIAETEQNSTLKAFDKALDNLSLEELYALRDSYKDRAKKAEADSEREKSYQLTEADEARVRELLYVDEDALAAAEEARQQSQLEKERVEFDLDERGNVAVIYDDSGKRGKISKMVRPSLESKLDGPIDVVEKTRSDAVKVVDGYQGSVRGRGRKDREKKYTSKGKGPQESYQAKQRAKLERFGRPKRKTVEARPQSELSTPAKVMNSVGVALVAVTGMSLSACTGGPITIDDKIADGVKSGWESAKRTGEAGYDGVACLFKEKDLGDPYCQRRGERLRQSAKTRGVSVSMIDSSGRTRNITFVHNDDQAYLYGLIERIQCEIDRHEQGVTPVTAGRPAKLSVRTGSPARKGQMDHVNEAMAGRREKAEKATKRAQNMPIIEKAQRDEEEGLKEERELTDIRDGLSDDIDPTTRASLEALVNPKIAAATRKADDANQEECDATRDASISPERLAAIAQAEKDAKVATRYLNGLKCLKREAQRDYARAMKK